MVALSVNINKLATLRNSRGKNNPDLVWWAREIEAMGAHGITVHPRPDERHIRYSDVRTLRPLIRGEFNIEGYPDESWLKLVEEVVPEQATLVPDPPGALTSNAGWVVRENLPVLETVAQRLRAKAIRVSVFIDPDDFSLEEARALSKIGVARIELYTERFAETVGGSEGQAVAQAVLARYKLAAEWARTAGLGVNAGHDLSLGNLRQLVSGIPWIDEVSIGHALICDALQFGMEQTIKRYLNSLSTVP